MNSTGTYQIANRGFETWEDAAQYCEICDFDIHEIKYIKAEEKETASETTEATLPVYVNDYLSDNLSEAVNDLASDLTKNDPKLSTIRASNLAAAYISLQIMAYCNDIEDKVKTMTSADFATESGKAFAKAYDTFQDACDNETWRAALVRITGTRTLIADEGNLSPEQD